MLRWLDASQKVFAEKRQQLTELDSAVGDGDFGISLDRGFTAVQAELSANPPADLRSVFQNVATVLIRTMGGTSGPSWAHFSPRERPARKSELAPADVVALFQAGVDGIQQRGKAALGDKTMLDALLPAVDAMRGALEAGNGLAEILERGAAAAEAACRRPRPCRRARAVAAIWESAASDTRTRRDRRSSAAESRCGRAAGDRPGPHQTAASCCVCEIRCYILHCFQRCPMKTRSICSVAAALALSSPPPPCSPDPLVRHPRQTDAATAGTQAQGHRRARYQVRSGARLHEAAPERVSGRRHRIARNSKGHIFVNTCAQQTKTFEFDEKGNYVREIGKELYGTCSVTARRCPGQHLGDRRGRNMIIKFNPEGRVTMVLGRGMSGPWVAW